MGVASVGGGGKGEFVIKILRVLLGASLRERLPDEQKKFMTKLRQDAYIKITDSYRPIVNPILFADERKDKPGKNN